jgi:hypothetical protein
VITLLNATRFRALIAFMSDTLLYATRFRALNLTKFLLNQIFFFKDANSFYAKKDSSEMVYDLYRLFTKLKTSVHNQ